MSNKILIIGCGGTGTRICNEMVQTLGYEMPYDRMSVVILDAHGSKGFESGAWKASKQNVYAMNSYTPVNQGVQSLVRQLEQENPGSVNDWFPKEMRLPTEAMYSDGCGAYRPYGKFFSYYYYDNIRATIQRGFDRLRHSDYLSHNQRGSTRVDVIICGSLGNGTGGGIFMDVAGIVNDMIVSTQQVEPRVYGFFVPSSVTWQGQNNSQGHNMLQPYQIAAAGYGALVELQMEFARKNQSIDPRMKPTKRYSAQFFSRRGDRFKHEIKFATPEKSAYDTVYLFDKKDDAGTVHSYQTVVKSAGQTLAALIGGQADPTGRLLDVGLRFQQQCFASMGVARLKVPTTDLTEALVCKLSQKIISEMCAAGTSVDMSQWGHLLNLTIGATQFPPPDSVDVSLQQYVEAFVGKFLKIQETGMTEEGDRSADINQLFDAFTEIEARGNAAITQHVKALRKAEGEDIVAKANAVADSLQTYLNGMPSQFGSILVDSKWSPVPREESFELLGGLEGVGGKFLIDGMVEKLVNNQAFGLLETWLDALWLEVKKNKDSVERTELAKYLKAQSFAGVEVNPEDALSGLGALKTKLSEQASGGLNGFFSKMMGGSEVEETVSEFLRVSKSAMNTVTWSVKVQAVEQFYNTVLAHIDRWRTVAVKLNAYIRGNEVLGYIDNRYSDVSTKLNGSTAANGAITEYLSCSPDSQEHLIKELLKDDKLKTENIFKNSDFAQTIWSLLYTKVEASEKEALLGTFRRNLGGDTVLREILRNQRTFLKEFPADFLGSLTSVLRPHVGPLCKVDNLLREDSEALIENYYHKVYKEDPTITLVERRRIEQELYRVVPHTFSDELRTIFGRGDSEMSESEKLKEATDIVFIGRLQALAKAALPKVDIRVEKANFIQGSANIIFGKGSDKLNAVRGALSSALSEVKCGMEELDTFPPDEILAIGGVYGMTLEDLNMEEIRAHYMSAMRESSEKDSRARFNFAPHTTREYMEYGAKYIAFTDTAAQQDYTAELVLALATMKPTSTEMVGKFAWLEFDRRNFKLVKPLPSHFTDGEALPSCMTSMSSREESKRFLEPHGFEDVIHWFEGASQTIPNGPIWLSGLKKLVWEEIKSVMFSDPDDFLAMDVEDKVFMDALDARISELDAWRKYPKIRASVEAMISALQRFKNEVEENGGFNEDQVPSMLTD